MIRELLQELSGEHKVLVGTAMTEAEHFSSQEEPDKDQIGAALERALGYASKAEGYADKLEKLIPHIKSASAWLGENWYKLLGFVGLAV